MLLMKLSRMQLAQRSADILKGEPELSRWIYHITENTALNHINTMKALASLTELNNSLLVSYFLIYKELTKTIQ